MDIEESVTPKRYRAQRNLTSWRSPLGQFAKGLLKVIHQRNAGFKPEQVLAEFKRCAPWLIDELATTMGKRPSDNMLKQRLDKGKRAGYEREWPDRNARNLPHYRVAESLYQPLCIIDRESCIAANASAGICPITSWSRVKVNATGLPARSIVIPERKEPPRFCALVGIDRCSCTGMIRPGIAARRKRAAA